MDATVDCTFTRYRLRLEHLPLPQLAGLEEELSTAHDAIPLLHTIVDGEPFEVVGALFLDTHHRPTGYTIAYRGTLKATAFEPRGVLAPALLTNSASLILFHNHPSGSLEPSDGDLWTTRKLKHAAEVLDLTLWDHFILGPRPSYESVLPYLAKPSKRKPYTAYRRPVKPKYRHPDSGETWSGRGFMAKWLRRELEQGRELEDFEV